MYCACKIISLLNFFFLFVQCNGYVALYTGLPLVLFPVYIFALSLPPGLFNQWLCLLWHTITKLCHNRACRKSCREHTGPISEGVQVIFVTEMCNVKVVLSARGGIEISESCQLYFMCVVH